MKHKQWDFARFALVGLALVAAVAATAAARAQRAEPAVPQYQTPSYSTPMYGSVPPGQSGFRRYAPYYNYNYWGNELGFRNYVPYNDNQWGNEFINERAGSGAAVSEPVLDYPRPMRRVRQVVEDVRAHSSLRPQINSQVVTVHEEAGAARFRNTPRSVLTEAQARAALEVSHRQFSWGAT